MRFYKYHALGNDYLVMNPGHYPGWGLAHHRANPRDLPP